NNWAKPKSMVIPRSRSAAQRSVVAPVRARTSADLPWSTCPAVAMTNCSVTLQPPRQWLVDVLGPDHHWLRARTADPLSSVPRRRAAKLPADRYVAAKRNPLVIRWPNRKVAHRLHRRHRPVPDENYRRLLAHRRSDGCVRITEQYRCVGHRIPVWRVRCVWLLVPPE